MADGSRNNPADVHRTSRTSLQFHHNNRHNVSHPIPKHTDKSQHRTPHHNPRTPKKIGTASHDQHRRIQKQANKATHPHNQELLKKARGVCRGAVALRPLCGFPQLPKARTPCLLPRKAKHTSHNKNKDKK